MNLRVRILSVVSLFLAIPQVGAAQEVLFYNGTYAGGSGPVNYHHEAGAIATYDNFVVGGYGWHVTGAYGTFLAAPGAVWNNVRWEIRRGISTGDGGELLFSGAGQFDTPYDATNAGGTYAFNRSITGMDFHLSPGEYWFSITLETPNPDILGAIYWTLGQDSFNATYPVNAFANYTGSEFVEPWHFNPIRPPDLTQYHVSVGMTGFQTVPEPATMTLLATGMLGLASARRRRR